jgi:FlaA1/EpsC-like NDP-sugar epimerase
MARDATQTAPGRVNSNSEPSVEPTLSSWSVVGQQISAAVNRFVYSRADQMFIDGVLVAGALVAAFLLRFDGTLPKPYDHQLRLVLPFVVFLYVSLNVAFGMYKQVWRFFSLRDVQTLANSVGIAFLVTAIWRYLVDPGIFAATPVPFGVLLIHPFLAFTAQSCARLTRRTLYERALSKRPAAGGPAVRKRVLLAGAGEAGLYLLHELADSDYKIVGFVDDDPKLQARTIGGWHVLGTTEELGSIVQTQRVDEVILCMPSAPKTVIQRIAAECASIGVHTSSVPALWEIMSGAVTISRLRPVNMENLLGRRAISHSADLDELSRAYEGRRILVTGAGGSIGSELVRQLSLFRPSQLILLDKDENNLYEITCEMEEDFEQVVGVVADIRNSTVMEKVFETHRPEVVFHAAAYKHVPLMEHYPAEAILNNVMGTRHVIDLSNAFGVSMFVLISTDKAVNPSSTMGASKRIAEMLVQELAARCTKTRLCCVRFGNVLGSRASVVPLFQRQIRQGKNIKVTHPDVRRYFMTIPEAVQLVIQAGSLGEKGEIFLLDMGDPVRIVDLARNLIELSGLVPEKDVAIEFTGLRPGEKLDEELLIQGERGVRSTKYSKIFVVAALEEDWSRLRDMVRDLEDAAHASDIGTIRRILRSLNLSHANAYVPRETQVVLPGFETADPQQMKPRVSANLVASTRDA